MVPLNILFDYHTIAALPYSGKFWNMTRFAECLSLDPAYSVHVIYDRPMGAVVPGFSMTHEFLRERAPHRHLLAKWDSAVRWENRMRERADSSINEHDRFLTEIVPGHRSAPLNPFHDSVLHVDFQYRDLIRHIKRIRRYKRFHVLTPVQKAQLVSQGIEPDTIHVIPNCLDLSLFPVPSLKILAGEPYAVYVHGAGSDWRSLKHIKLDGGLRLVTVGLEEVVSGAIQYKHLSWSRYVQLVSRAEFAICLTPAGDSTTTRLFEYAAMGVPFIAPPSRGMQELLPHGVYDFSTDYAFDRDTLSHALLQEVRQFSYEATLPKLKELFE